VPPTPKQNRIQLPGSVQDKLAMLVYHLPETIREQSTSLDDFRRLAEAMDDYALFEPRIWRHVCVDGTLEHFRSTALYQLALRVRIDPDVDEGAYPSFEVDWRRSLATQLQEILPTPPVALCPSIHRVIPIGVSSNDAMQAMQVAIPKDIQNPYAITVQSSALDDRCGSIAITQPMRYTIITINCMIDPGLIVDVCRELRTGHRAVVNEVHSMKRKHDETNTQLATMRLETGLQLSILQKEMATLVKKLTTREINGLVGSSTDERPIKCSRKRCSRMTTKRFLDGKRQKQCEVCLAYGTRRKVR
jgi:hypothetical protein